MWSCDRRALLAGALSLGACGFSPVYGPQGQGRAFLQGVTLEVPSSEIGFAFREAFEQRLPPQPGTAATRPRLRVSLSIRRRARVIETDNSITRFNLLGRASYQLFGPLGAVEDSGEVASTTEVSATANAFASQVAERDARDRLVRDMAERLALRLSALAPA